MKSTRERILETLLERRRCTINELADAVGINPISVRHHIIKLESQQLVASEEERQGVGRPPRVYFLTEAGMEKFPTRYLQLTNRLIEQLKETLPEPTVSQIFTNLAHELASRYTGDNDFESLPMVERLDLLKRLLSKEGFTVEWEQEGDRFLVHEISCPYYQVGQFHPEVCLVDETIISNLLAVPTERVKCILSGDDYCTYVINVDEIKTAESTV